MKQRLVDIRLRRARLQSKIEAQRVALGVITSRWERPLAVADAGIGVARFLKAHPVAVAGISALIVLRWRGISGLARAAWRVWGVYRSAASYGRKAFSGLLS